MKSLAALAPVSMVGVVAVLLTAAFMGVRCFDGSYAAGGAFVQTLVPSLQPSFGHTPLRVLAPTSLLLGSMAATAYLVHFVAPDFYHNLQDNTESRFTILTATGFSIMAVLSCAITAMGFLTFGGNSAGMILNNYSTSDMGASACRFLMALSLIGSYPFAFSPMKSGLMTMLQNKGK
jgi:amino acid permease